MKLFCIARAALPVLLFCASGLPTRAWPVEPTPATASPLLTQWLQGGPYAALMADPAAYHLQILLTEIKRGNPTWLTHHRYRPDAEYFYPASTVKLPVAALALEYLQQRGISPDHQMTRAAAWPTDIGRDQQHYQGVPSVAEDVRRILLVSDNDSYNRLYELLGPAYINQRLQALGYAPVQIRHRLERFLAVTQNHQLPAIRFHDARQQLVLALPPRQDPLTPLRPATPVGSAHWRDGQLITEPLDFASRNQWTLAAMHQLTLQLADAKAGGPVLGQAARRLLDYYRQVLPHQLLSATRVAEPQPDLPNAAPACSGQACPHKTATVPADAAYLQAFAQQSDTAFKFLYYGGHGSADPSLVIRNKVGDAYGFYLDTAWFCDRQTGAEFVLSAVIYANSDRVLGDSRYDDKTLAMPYLAWLGQQAVSHFRREAAQQAPRPAAVRYCQNAQQLLMIDRP